MEKKTEYKINDNGSFTQTETIRTTPEDGVVPEREIKPAALPSETMGKYHKGYSTTKYYTTNDPRITRPLVWLFCGIFLLIGVVALVMHLWLFGILFIAAAIFTFVKSKKDIDAIAEKLEKQGKDVTIDSAEELKEVTAGVAGDLKAGFQESAQETFTKSNFRRMTKLTLPFYCILGLIVSVALSFVVSIRMGIFVFLLFTVGGILFYGVLFALLAKICEK